MLIPYNSCSNQYLHMLPFFGKMPIQKGCETEMENNCLSSVCVQHNVIKDKISRNKLYFFF